MYSLVGYGEMLADRIRREAYQAALEATIRPGATVIEIGSGPGYFAVIAVKLGAAKVYGIEPDESIHLARVAARDNGVAEHTVFLQQLSTRFTPAQRADVLFSDLRGVLPLFRDHLPVIADARARLLAPGGAQIPARDELWGAVVSADESYDRLLGGWRATDLDLEAARTTVANGWTRASLDAEACLTAPQRWAELDYRHPLDANVRGRLDRPVERSGTAHGIALWFDTELCEGIGFSNRPGAPPTLYRQAFFPFPEPLEVQADDSIVVDLDARLIGGDYVWRWTTVHQPRDETQRGRRFEQSTFFGTKLSPDSLARRAGTHQPVLGRDGEILGFVLARMDGSSTNDEIADAVFGGFPDAFSSRREALARVCDIAVRYGS